MKKNIFRIIMVIMLAGAVAFEPGLLYASNYAMISNYLYEQALSYYKRGDLKSALHEFRKLLIIEPDNTQALYYVRLIEGKEGVPEKIDVTVIPDEGSQDCRQQVIEGVIEVLEQQGRQKAVLLPEKQPAPAAPPAASKALTAPEKAAPALPAVSKAKPAAEKKELKKDELVKKGPVKKAPAPEAKKTTAEKPALSKKEKVKKEPALTPAKPIKKVVEDKAKIKSQAPAPLPAKEAPLKSREEALVEALKAKQAAAAPAETGPAILKPVEGTALKSGTAPSAVKQKEELPAEEPVPEKIKLTVKRSGVISLFVDGAEASLQDPIILKEGQPLISLRDAAAAFFYSLYDLGGAKYRLISADGQSREVRVAKSEGGIAFLGREELKEYFGVESRYDDNQKALYLNSPQPPEGFTSYTVQKSPQELFIPQEPQAVSVGEEKDSSMEKPNILPPSVRPSIDLRLSNSYTYVTYHAARPYKSLISSLSGRFFDFTVQGYQEYKDINSKFDHANTWLNLEKPGLSIGLFDQGMDLNPLRGQYQAYEGLKVVKSSGQNKTTFFGGNINNYTSGTSGTVKYLGEMVGLGQEFYPVDWLGLKALLIYLNNYADTYSPGGTAAYPRRNLVAFFDGNLKVNPRLSFFSQFAHAYYTPDNDSAQTVQDWDWRAGSQWKGGRANARVAYEFVGDRYASVGNPAGYNDYKGVDFNGSYKLFDWWTLFGFFTYYRNNVDANELDVTSKNQSYNIGSSHVLPHGQSLNLLYSNSLSNPSGPNPGSSNRSYMYRLDYFTPFLEHNFVVNYQFYKFDSADLTQDYYSHTGGGTVFKTFGPGSTWNLRQEVTKTYYKTNPEKTNMTSSFSLYQRILPNLNFTFNPAYNYERSQGQKSTSNITCSSSLWYQMDKDTSFRTDYTINKQLHDGKSWPRSWSVLWSINKSFNMTTPMRFGHIRGKVLMDSNNNYRLDPSDNPVEGVKIKLEDGRVTRTAKDGVFYFKYAVPQKQRLTLDLEDLALAWTSKDTERQVSVSAYHTTNVDILLVKSASVSGRVFIDKNADKLYQENEEPLEGVRVVLLPDNVVRVTDGDGRFKFDELLLGRYKVALNREDVPAGYEVSSPPEREVLVLPGEENKDYNFSLRLKESPRQ